MAGRLVGFGRLTGLHPTPVSLHPLPQRLDVYPMDDFTYNFDNGKATLNDLPQYTSGEQVGKMVVMVVVAVISA